MGSKHPDRQSWWWLHRSVLVVLVGLATGCSHAPTLPSGPSEAEKRRHVVRVDELGQLLQLDGKQADETYAKRELLEPLSAAVVGGERRVLVFVHGGLNGFSGAMEHVEEKLRPLLNAGYYPLFVIWPSGFGSTYREHLTTIRQGVREDGIGGRAYRAATLPLMFIQDIATGLVRAPMTVANTIRSDFETSVSLESKLFDLDDFRNTYRRLVAAGRPIRIGDDWKSDNEMTLRAASYAATFAAKAAVSGPAIDAFGRAAWDDMLRRTQMVYPGPLATGSQREIPDDEFRDARDLGPLGSTIKRRRVEAKRSGMRDIVTSLERLQCDYPDLKVTLVGHSMGTIVLNHVLEATTLKDCRIIYLAAACSVRDYSVAVLPYLRRNSRAESFNLMLHPMAEVGEWQVGVLDLTPRGSLLVWIDNFLANPVSELDRTFGRWTNLFMVAPTGRRVVEDLLEDCAVSQRIQFRAFSVGDGEKPRAEKHQWNEKPAAERPVGFVPERHGEVGGVDFWREDVLQARPRG